MIRRPTVALVMRARFEENQQIMHSIADYKRRHTDWHVFIDDQARGAQQPEWLLEQPWDGIICKEPSERLIEMAIERKIPCVDLSDDGKKRVGCPKVTANNRAIGHAGAEHFLERGFKHFAFCGFDNERWSRERHDGFVEAIELAGMGHHSSDTHYPGIIEPTWQFNEEGHVADWLKTLPKPIAVMACNDMRALHLVDACHELGLRVPDEVAILGANNETIRCELSNPALSSVPVNAGEYSRIACEALEGMMRGRPASDFPDALVDPSEVVTRRSTNVLAIEDKAIAAAVSFIRENACRGLSVDMVAKYAHISRSLLEKRFRSHLGRSPQVEIRHAQVLRVKDLLADTDYSLAQIAELTGFEHPEYLSVVFKRLARETPSSYRRRAKAAVASSQRSASRRAVLS